MTAAHRPARRQPDRARAEQRLRDAAPQHEQGNGGREQAELAVCSAMASAIGVPDRCWPTALPAEIALATCGFNGRSTSQRVHEAST
jgi:hypothetical protein